MRMNRTMALLLGGLFFLAMDMPAEAQGLTKQQYVRQRMQWARNNPRWNPTQEELEARFDGLDVDGDGILTEEELEAGRADRQGGGQAQGMTKEQYVRQRMQWARNNPRWNPTREELEARFDELDADGDGILTDEEYEAGRRQREEDQDRGLTKQQYVRQRLQWARNDPRWNPTREELEARFDELDTDGDGFLTEEELEAGRR